MSRFAAATAVVARGDGSFDAEISPEWAIGDRPNGGYLVAIMARAAVEAVTAAGAPHPHPLAAAATYLAAPPPGPALLLVDVLRTGRTASQARVALMQEGRARVEAQFTLGRLGEAAPRWSGIPLVELPPAGDCVRLPADPPGRFQVPLFNELELRVDPAVMGWAAGKPEFTGEVRGWLRTTDGTEPDPFLLLLAVDATPPATFDLGSTGWVPTLTLSTYVRAAPAPGPLRFRQRAGLVADGFVDEVCEVWDSRDRLVASATQFAAVRFPD